MDNDLFSRVRADAGQIQRLTKEGLNFSLNGYVNETGLLALCDAFTVDPADWTSEWLEQILIIREGLYEDRNKLRDKGDHSEHSLEQVLIAVDRLYADLERALREVGKSDLVEAQQHLSRLRQGQGVAADSVQNAVDKMQAAAGDLLSETHKARTSIEVNILKIEQININFDLFRNSRLTVQRLSASVLAISLSLQQNVIFQGVFRFLTEGAEKILADLGRVVDLLRRAYSGSRDFISQLTKVTEKGFQFVRLMSNFLDQIFGDNEHEVQKGVSLRLEKIGPSFDVLCGIQISPDSVVCGGTNGHYRFLRISDMSQIASGRWEEAIRAMDIWSETSLACATASGLDLVDVPTKAIRLSAKFHDGINHVLYLDEERILTSSGGGRIQQWRISANLIKIADVKIGNSIQKIARLQKNILIADDNQLIELDGETLSVVRKIPFGFSISDFEILNDGLIAACGERNVALMDINESGQTRFIGTQDQMNYVSVRSLSGQYVCVASDSGQLEVIDVSSGLGVGTIQLSLGYRFRRLIKLQNRLLALYGKTIAWINWEEVDLPEVESF